MSERRKRSRLVWSSIALLGSIVMYPLSYGPTVFVLQRVARKMDAESFDSIVAVAHVFYPLEQGVRRCPAPINEAFGRYVDWWNTVGQF